MAVWRLCASTITLIIAGLGCFFVACVIVPLLRLVSRCPHRLQQRVQYVISLSFAVVITCLRSLGFMRLRLDDMTAVQQDRGCLIVCNHPSLLDIIIIISKLRACNIVVKQSLWHNFFIRNVISFAGYIRNDSGEKIPELLQANFAAGHNLFIFPEGTRSTPGQPLKLQRGAANIAIRMNVPIRVLYLTCQPAGLTKTDKWYTIYPDKLHFHLSVGELIDPQVFLAKAGNPSLAARHLTRYLQQKFEQGITHE